MTTLAHTPPASAGTAGPPPYAGPGTLLHGVSWETYERLRDETDAAGQVLSITYDHGRMLVMSPLPEHERWKKVLGRMVELMSLDLRIPIASLGSTTWKRRDRGIGLEADECYYVQNEQAVRGKRDLDLAGGDPPPDLAFESERTRGSAGKLDAYAALGVRELWRYDGTRLIAVVLREAVDGQRSYAVTETSLAFPFLRPADLGLFLARVFETDETTLLLEFRDWVAANLKP